MRPAALLALVASSLVAEPSVSEACSKRHQPVFELFDDATTVAEVQVTKVPPSTRQQVGAGPVTLRVKRTLKGKPRATLTTQETNTSCHIGFRTGRQALVFLGKDGSTLGHFEGYREDLATWNTVTTAWAEATDDATRVAILISAIEGSDRMVAFDAAFYLANQPALIAQLDPKARARLATAAKTAPSHTQLPLLLVRLRDASAVDKLVRSDEVAAKAFLAETAFENVTDASALADAIRDGKGERDPKRIAAFERCERVHGRALYPFTSYSNGMADHFWPKLAEVCRTGTPHHY